MRARACLPQASFIRAKALLSQEKDYFPAEQYH